jgi:hypothetical protein
LSQPIASNSEHQLLSLVGAKGRLLNSSIFPAASASEKNYRWRSSASTDIPTNLTTFWAEGCPGADQQMQLIVRNTPA